MAEEVPDSERVSEPCPRCRGTGEIHGSYRFSVGTKVHVQHGGRWYDGEIVDRFMEPTHGYGGLKDFYRVSFVLKGGETRSHAFHLGINPIQKKTDA